MQNILIFLIFLLLPTYTLRFHMGPFPTTVLEILLLALFGWFGVQILREKKFRASAVGLVKKYKFLFLGIGIFLLGATISIFTAVDIKKALGEWRAFYIEPVLLFFVLNTYFQTLEKETRKKFVEKYILFPLLVCGIITSLFAIYQHFTGFFVPSAFWANRNTFRVTAWYGFPNAVGLFLAPLVSLALYGISTQSKKSLLFFASVLFLLTSPFALLFAKGSGPIIGVLAGIGTLLLFNKKIRVPIIIAGIFALLGVFFLPKTNSLRQEIFMQDRSGQIRLAIWHETKEFLKDHPLAGAGLASYEEKIVPYHQKVNGENIEIFHHPHNIFLTIWVNTGIVGLIGFVTILFSFFFSTLKQNKEKLLCFLISGIVILLVSGLVDSPYIKNDLAILFWVFPLLL